MRTQPEVNRRLRSGTNRQARIGIVAGLLLGLILNNYVSLPMATINAAVSNGISFSELGDQLGQGEFRLGVYCRTKNRRVTYHVKAANAGGAHRALEWVLPACQLKTLTPSTRPADGERGFEGHFYCQNAFYRTSISVRAKDRQDALSKARAQANGCQVETLDQLRCSTLAPFCAPISEDLRLEAELMTHRLLR
jgi:hypothetical protein